MAVCAGIMILFPPIWYLSAAKSSIALAPIIVDYATGKEVQVTPQTRPREPYSASQTPPTNDLKEYLKSVANIYGENYELLEDVVSCESNWNTSAVGDNFLAYGIAQFHRPTFDGFCVGDYYNPYDQLYCMTEMFSNGYGYHWSCLRIVVSNYKK